MRSPLAGRARLAAAALVVLCSTPLALPVRALEVGFIVPLSSKRGGQALALALLAARDFNARNATAAPWVAEVADCDVQLNVTAFDYDVRSCSSAIDGYLRGVNELKWTAMIGAARSSCSVPIASLSAHFDVAQVGFASTSPSLDDTTIFPYFARVIPSDTAATYALARYIRLFGWRRIGLLHEDGQFGSLYAQQLNAFLVGTGIDVVSSAFEYGDESTIEPSLRALHGGASLTAPRVLVLVVWTQHLRATVAALAALGMVGEKYHYIFSDALDTNALGDASEPYLRHLDGSAQILPGGTNTEGPAFRALEERVRASTWAEWRPHVRTDATGRELSAEGLGWSLAQPLEPLAVFGYDAMALIARAACALPAEAEPSSGRALHAQMLGTGFWGISGRVELDAETGSRSASTARFVLRSLRSVAAGGAAGAAGGTALQVISPVGVFEEDGWVLGMASHQLLFHGGARTPPLDGTGANCEAGERLGDEGCEPCPEGYVSPNAGTVECIPCPAGSYAESVTLCTACESDSYQPDEARSECLPCPEHAAYIVHSGEPRLPFWVQRGARNRSSCACTRDFYAPAGTPQGELCLPCPEGGVCRGTGYEDRIVPVPRPGYYSRRRAPEVMLRCLDDEQCPGGAVAACGPHLVGDMCTQCEPGYFMLQRACYRCDSAQRQPLLTAALVLALALSGIHLTANLQKESDHGALLMSSTMSAASEIGVVIFFLQILNLMSAVAVQWPHGLRVAMGWFSWVNVDLSLFALECEHALPFVFAWELKATLPFIFMLGYVLSTLFVSWPWALWASRRRERRGKLRACSHALYRSVNATVLAHSLLYIATARHTLEAFACAAQPDGTLTLPSNPAIDCSSELYLTRIRPTALACLLCYVLAFPLGLGVCFVLGAQRGRAPGLSHALDMCTLVVRIPYKRRFFFYEVLDLLRKLLVAVALNFARGLGGRLHVALITILMVGALRVQTVFRPYKHRSVNALSEYLLTVIILVLIVGGMVYDEALAPGVREGFDIVLYVTIASVVVLAAAHVAYGIAAYLMTRRRFTSSGSVRTSVPDERHCMQLNKLHITPDIIEGVTSVLNTVPAEELIELIARSIDDEDVHVRMNDAIVTLFSVGIGSEHFTRSSEGQHLLELASALRLTPERLSVSVHGMRASKRLESARQVTRPLSHARASRRISSAAVRSSASVFPELAEARLSAISLPTATSEAAKSPAKRALLAADDEAAANNRLASATLSSPAPSAEETPLASTSTRVVELSGGSGFHVRGVWPEEAPAEGMEMTMTLTEASGLLQNDPTN